MVGDVRMLKKTIDKKRRKMIYFGIKYGLSHSKTVKCSQELDSLLNFYQKIQKISITLANIQAK